MYTCILYTYIHIYMTYDMYMWHVYCILYTWHMTCGSRVWRMASLQQLVTVDICTLVTPPYTAYYILYTAHCIYIVHFSPHTAHTGLRWHLQHFSSSIPSRAPHSAFDGSDDGELIALIAPTYDWHRDAIWNIESPHIITLESFLKKRKALVGGAI